VSTTKFLTKSASFGLGWQLDRNADSALVAMINFLMKMIFVFKINLKT
jgi:hypothetical protein